jgi:hypothetical protein
MRSGIQAGRTLRKGGLLERSALLVAQFEASEAEIVRRERREAHGLGDGLTRRQLQSLAAAEVQCGQ